MYQGAPGQRTPASLAPVFSCCRRGWFCTLACDTFPLGHPKLEMNYSQCTSAWDLMPTAVLLPCVGEKCRLDAHTRLAWPHFHETMASSSPMTPVGKVIRPTRKRGDWENLNIRKSPPSSKTGRKDRCHAVCGNFLKNAFYDDLAFNKGNIMMRMFSFRYLSCLRFRIYNDLCTLWWCEVQHGQKN